jgi:O-antigen ligase
VFAGALVFTSIAFPLLPFLPILLAIAIVTVWFAATNDEFGLYAFALASTMVSLKSRTADSGMIDIFAGMIIIGVALSTIVKVRILSNQRFFSSPLQYILCAYYLYAFLLGIVGIAFWNISANTWFRESLIQLPLIIIPVLMRLAFDKDKDRVLKRFLYVVVAIWFVTVTVNLIVFRQNVAKAYYLFETGRSSMEISIPSLCLFTFVSLSAVVNKVQKRVLLFAALYTIVAIGLSLFRTLWLVDAMLLPFIVYLMYTDERKSGMRFLLSMTIAVAIMLIVLSTLVPFIGLFLQSLLLRLLYSSAVTTDPSLVNRYIEWNSVWETIRQAPIIGYGYGATYFDYNWILGYSYHYGFTHNGYLYLLLKSGLVGSIILSSAYILFIIKGLKYSLLQNVDAFHRALFRAGVAFLIGLLFTNITLNALALRDSVFWVSVIFGYILYFEKKSTST